MIYLVPVGSLNYPIQYHPQSSFIYPHQQMVNVNRISVHQSYRPRSLTRVSESSSGIEIIDEETNSSDCEPLVIRYHTPPSSSSSSCSSRRVVINSIDQRVTITNKRRSRERRQWKKSSTEKKRSVRHSSKYTSQYSSSERRDYKGDRLKRLFERYSNEDIHREWKPLTLLESRELYQYADDKHYKKSRYN